MGKQCQTLFFWAPKSLQMMISAMKLKDAYSLELCIQMGISFLFSFAFHFSSFLAIFKAYLNKHFAFLHFLYYLANKGSSSQGYSFSSDHIWMWELDCEEGWVPKNWCFWTVVWRRLLSPLDHKEIQPVHPKGNQSWIFIGRTDVEADIPILWPPNMRYWLIWKDADAGKDWREEEEGDNRGWDGWIVSLTMDMSLNKFY